MKRFWREATVAPHDDHFIIQLDNRPMRLPNGPSLRLHSQKLADAIAAEWQNAGAEMTMDDVPLTRLAATAQERIVPDPAPTAAAIARYGQTDTLCYRAAQPEALVIRQHHAWQPWLDWAAATHGARLNITHSLMPITQSPDAIAALHAATAALSPFDLTALGILVPSFGSLVLGLAVAAGRLDALEAHRISVLDELYQEQLWGEDADATARRANVRRDVADAARFMILARP